MTSRIPAAQGKDRMTGVVAAAGYHRRRLAQSESAQRAGGRHWSDRDALPESLAGAVDL